MVSDTRSLQSGGCLSSAKHCNGCQKGCQAAENGEKVDSLEALSNLWINTADPVFLEVFRSDRYLEAQNELLSATMINRIQQREMAELALKYYDIPTRTEVDNCRL